MFILYLTQIAFEAKRCETTMNGENKKGFVLALVSFAAGALCAAVLGNPGAREKLIEGSKRLLEQ